MTGPWANFGREDGSDQVDQSPAGGPAGSADNPYLPSATQSARAIDGYWQRPPDGNPYLSGSLGSTGDGRPLQNPNPYVGNPYLSGAQQQNPYLYAGQNPYDADPYAQQWQLPPSGAWNGPAQQAWPAGPAPELPAARPAGHNWSLITAVIVMVAIVVAAAVILFGPSDSTTSLPPAASGANTPDTTGAAPVPTDGAARSQAAPSIDDEAVKPTTTSPSVPTAVAADLAAAKAAGSAWVSAINADHVATAQALSCSSVSPKITKAFVQSVDGSIGITSITLATGGAGTNKAHGTLSFTYRKTTDTVRQQDHLSLIIEGGIWKVCG